MDQNFQTKSLLPWLNQGSSKIHLDISVREKSLDAPGRISTPFLLLNTSSPLFRLVRASYMTPSGKAVKDIFLLVQNDHCSFTEKSTHFNNTEIDRLWQEAFACEGSAAEGNFFDGLAESVNDQTSFPLWQSLFYCERRKCYFHPPCPQCGNSLTLCHQDEILAKAGLPLYTSSLERFLFCPVCHESPSGTDFYIHDGGEGLSAKVKDRWDVIDGFGRLVSNGLQGLDFPCPACSEQKECYESGLATSRISPFAFYPFRMLVTDAGQLPAEDFLAILSGASCTELQNLPQFLRDPGRAACIEAFHQQRTEDTQLFFENDGKSFLEIFYLKIALLEQVVRTTLPGSKHLEHVDLRLSLDQFWVNFPDYRGLLPLFWNFEVRPIALGICPPEDISFVRVPESLGLHTLALLWFNALLVNKEQSAADVQHALALLDDKKNPQEEPDFLAGTINDRGVFGPENIFWFPAQKQIDQSWLALWNKALCLGWSLLQSSFHSSGFSERFIFDEITNLAAELKRMLFTAKEVSTEMKDVDEGVGEDVDDAAILRILLALREKWKEEVIVAKDEAVAEEPEQMEEETGPAPEETDGSSQEEELEKTVILSADQLAVMMEKGDQPPREDMSAEISAQTGGDDSGQEVELEKTVIMNLNDLSTLLPEEKEPPGVAGQECPPPESQYDGKDDEELSETVIINPEELQKLRKLKNGNK